jgi:hypothetical protein
MSRRITPPNGRTIRNTVTDDIDTFAAICRELNPDAAKRITARRCSGENFGRAPLPRPPITHTS